MKVNLLCFLRCTTIQTTVTITNTRIKLTVIGTTTDTITTVFLFEVEPSVEDPNSDVGVSGTTTAVVGFCTGVVVWPLITPLPVVGPSLVVVIKVFCVVVSPPAVELISVVTGGGVVVCAAIVVAVVCAGVVGGFSSLVTSLPLVVVGLPVVTGASVVVLG
jgi:hypothetical protein